MNSSPQGFVLYSFDDESITDDPHKMHDESNFDLLLVPPPYGSVSPPPPPYSPRVEDPGPSTSEPFPPQDPVATREMAKKWLRDKIEATEMVVRDLTSRAQNALRQRDVIQQRIATGILQYGDGWIHFSPWARELFCRRGDRDDELTLLEYDRKRCERDLRSYRAALTSLLDGQEE